MQEFDKAAFETLMISTAGMYNRQLDSLTIGMYFNALARFDINDVRTGFNRHIQNPDSGQYWPKPADIIRNLQGASETRSGAAWTVVDKTVRTVGPYQNVVFDDPVIHAVISDMGGWITLCNSSAEDYPFRANEFKKRYAGYLNNPPSDYPKMLIGISQATNDAAGKKHIDKPRVIGCIDTARLVYSGGANSAGSRPKVVSLESLMDTAAQNIESDQSTGLIKTIKPVEKNN